MLDIMSLFIRPALAADTAAAVAPAGDTQAAIMRFLPLFLIFGVFYMLLIRPQQKQLEKQTAMLTAIKKGDRVVTSGGIEGLVTKLDGEKHLMVQIADGVVVRIVRSTVTSLVQDTVDEKPAEKK